MGEILKEQIPKAQILTPRPIMQNCYRPYFFAPTVALNISNNRTFIKGKRTQLELQYRRLLICIHNASDVTPNPFRVIIDTREKGRRIQRAKAIFPFYKMESLFNKALGIICVLCI